MDDCVIGLANSATCSSFHNWIVTRCRQKSETTATSSQDVGTQPYSYPDPQIITDLRPILIISSHLSLTLHFSYSINILYASTLYLLLLPSYTCWSTNFNSTSQYIGYHSFLVFDRYRVQISARWPANPNDVNCDFLQSLQANACIKWDQDRFVHHFQFINHNSTTRRYVQRHCRCSQAVLSH